MLRKVQSAGKYSCLSPEELNVGQEYTFSFNPQEQPLFEKFYRMKVHNLKDWSQQQYNILTSLKYCTISVYTEISSKGRFHYHGYIRPNQMPEFVINDLAKLRHYGTYEIDKINNEDKWLDYVVKQEKFMRIYCNKHEMHYEIDSNKD